MTVRAVEGKKPYTGGTAIEITEDKVINLLLREANNLLQVDGNNELYCDLQLNDELRPTDDFPVGVTTGRIIEDNGWDRAGTILCAKTTSGDNIKLVYTDEGEIWVDNGTGTFKRLYLKPEIDAILQDYVTLDYLQANYPTTEYVDSHDTQVSTTEPTTPTEGMLWYNTSNGKLKVYDGSAWQDIGSGGGGSYTAGNGINIDQNNEISVDTSVVATQSDLSNGLADKQDVLAAGSNIIIEEKGRDTQGPAPEGFHVPLQSEWAALCGVLTTTLGLANNATTMGTYLKMPMAGRRERENATINRVGTAAYYWTSTPSITASSRNLGFSKSIINPTAGDYRASGISVRCFKDSSVIPTSSWTTLYDGSGVATGAGVFYNSTDGLISISGDGQTWYTIMDKNLGATTVFNQGDTETDSNCGYFYQRGNNYGFAHSGTVTTSSIQVDTSNYGPGNYYSSSTFITGSDDRSSVQNKNLRGGVTQGQRYSPTISATVSVVSGDTGTTYTIKVSDTAPAVGTPDTTLTFVY